MIGEVGRDLEPSRLREHRRHAWATNRVELRADAPAQRRTGHQPGHAPGRRYQPGRVSAIARTGRPRARRSGRRIDRGGNLLLPGAGPVRLHSPRSAARLARRPAAGPARTKRPRLERAGCASGEEAYTLAILLQEEGLGEPACVLATDISHAALAKARKAVFTNWSLRGEETGRTRPYLRSQGANWVLADEVRRHVTFAHLNLALDVYPSFATGAWGMDLILCRNVLIYFDPETIEAVAPACSPPSPRAAGSSPPLRTHRWDNSPPSSACWRTRACSTGGRAASVCTRRNSSH